MPAIQLDLYLTNLHPIQWRTKDLARVVDRRIGRNRPVIIDGVLLLDALDQIGRNADFLVCVTGGYKESTLASQIAAYQLRQKVLKRANFTIGGYQE